MAAAAVAVPAALAALTEGDTTPEPTRQPADAQRPRKRPPELDEDFSNPVHIQAFADALALEEDESLGDSSFHIIAVPDWAPIRQRIRKASHRSQDVTREGWAYSLARWPLLVLIFTAIAVEFLVYVLVRQIVNIHELIWAWRGQRGVIRRQLRTAATYEDWKATALEMDDHLGFAHWKKSAPNAYYDSSLIRRVRDNLREMREKDDAEGIKTVLEVALKSNFAGGENARLYSETYYGSKQALEEYLDEVERCLQYVRGTDQLSLDEKANFYRTASKNLGTSALCLSGGASFGYYHFGVARALLDADLLPRIISGTSAGSLIAAFLCTHTDDELDRLIIPELADRITACEDPFTVWFVRYLRTGARFNAVDWADKAAFFTHGSMTFKEAYERTGRILNISVIPFETHSPTKLLNFINAPDCIIWSACIASAAVPGILNPVVLLRKNKQGEIVPWAFEGRHKDGSLRVDIPLQSLHLLFNTSFSIVSQVNPHLHYFAFAPRGAPGRPVSHRRGKGWRGGFFLSALEQYLKIELVKNFRVIRDLELMPEFGGQNWSSVFLQEFQGSVNILPRTRPKDWIRILSDPDQQELARMIDVGKRATWPRLHMIANRLRIERQLDRGREEVRRAPLERSLVKGGSDQSTLESASDGGQSTHLAAVGRKKRNEIIRRLGLDRNASQTRFSSDSATEALNGNVADVNMLRRRRSLGQVRLANRVRQRSHRLSESSDSDEDIGYSSG